MNKKKLSFICVVIILSLIFITDCHDQKKNGEEENKIAVGVLLPLTGNGAVYGEAERKGMELALKHYNSAKRIKFIYEDSQTNPKTGVAAAMKLIQVDKVNIIIGALASSVTLAIAPIAERENILLITPGSSSPLISGAGDYIFRLYPSDDYQGKLLAECAIKKAITKMGILHLNNDYGRGLKDKFTSVFEKEGGTVLISEAYEQDESNFKSHLTKINSKAIDGLFIIGAGQENSTILKQMKELRIKVQVLAPDSFKDENIVKLAGEATEGVIFTAPRSVLDKSKGNVQRYFSEFSQTYGHEPNVFSSYGYDTVSLIISLVAKFGGDTKKIKDELYRVKYNGVTGKVSFDENGDLITIMDFWVVKNGKFERVECE